MLSPAESEALWLSLSVAARSVAFNLPFAILVAWLLTRTRFAGRTLFDAFVHLPLVLPPVVVGYLLLVLFGVRGPIGGWLHENFGIQLAFTSTGAALATAVMSFPLVVRAIRISLENVDRGLEEAARTLGAGPVDRFVSITLPLIAPGILAGAVTAFAAGLGEFGAVITFAANIPGETRTLPLALYTALQTPDGDALAARLAMISLSLGPRGPAGLRISESRDCAAGWAADVARRAPETARRFRARRRLLRAHARSHRALRQIRMRQVHADLADRRPPGARRRPRGRSTKTSCTTASVTCPSMRVTGASAWSSRMRGCFRTCRCAATSTTARAASRAKRRVRWRSTTSSVC